MPYFLGARAIRGSYTAVFCRALRERTARGFTIIELVVVTGIIAIITGLILVSDSRFGGQILLENLAYDMALSIRQAQVYGVAVQRFGTNIYTAGYGMHFDTSSPYSYLTFADAVTTNGTYDCPTPGNTATCELYNSTAIDRGFRIAKLCVPAGADSKTCTSVNPLDILFIRPDPDACISFGGTQSVQVLSGGSTCISANQDARIVLQSPRGDISSILVESNGQITVEKN